MNIHESLLDEFKDEAKFNQLGLTDEQKEAWIMVSFTTSNALTVRLHHTTVCMDEQFVVIDTVNSFGIRTSFLTENCITLFFHQLEYHFQLKTTYDFVFSSIRISFSAENYI